MPILLGIMSLLLLSACGNPYRANFNSTRDRHPQWLENRLAPKTKTPKLIETDEIQKEGWELAEKGYIMIGFAKFDLPRINPELALAEGKRAGADIVLLQRKFSKSLTETTTITQWPATETTEIRENTGVTGERGTHHINRRVDVTTYRGPETTYVPTQVDYFEHSATYWRKVERPIFGAIVMDLSDEQKQRLQTNRGLVVRTLVTDSPAYQADLLKGDIILKMDGEAVGGVKKFYDDLITRAGKTVLVTLVRNGKEIQIPVVLNP